MAAAAALSFVFARLRANGRVAALTLGDIATRRQAESLHI
jgi:hypothetical protein